MFGIGDTSWRPLNHATRRRAIGQHVGTRRDCWYQRRKPTRLTDGPYTKLRCCPASRFAVASKSPKVRTMYEP